MNELNIQQKHLLELIELHTFAMHKEPRRHIAGWRVKRESGANPEQYLLLCIPTPIQWRSFGLLHSLPLAKAGKAQQTGWVRRPTLMHFKIIPAGIRVRIKTIYFNQSFWEDGHYVRMVCHSRITSKSCVCTIDLSFESYPYFCLGEIIINFK